MKKRFELLIIVTALALLTAAPVAATNGDNMIAVGPIARSMGGVGVAHPLDAISAVFANPAAMCFGPYCPSGEFDFAGTLFMPKVSAEITNSAGTFKADGESNVYAIPAIGLSVPITKAPPFWRFGIAAYGVTGLGVDYRGTAIDQPQFYNFGPMGQFPMVAGEYTQLQIMKFAPAVAFQPNERFSLGLAVHIDYATLDLRNGSSSGYAFGAQLGALYQPTDRLSFGASYVTPQKVTHENVTDFDGDGQLDDLDLESPQQLAFGAAYTFLGGKLLLEGDAKWLNWSSADGYEDFDWEDQWVFAIGAQYQATPKLTLRAGFNYGKNPVKEHNGFSGTTPIAVQGKYMPTYYYETFRVIGFPAIVEQHLTFGLGYEFSSTFAVHVGYMYGFEETIRETGTDITGQPVSLASTLSESSVEIGLTWRF